MAVNPTISFDKTEINTDWEALYASDEFNAILLALPRGVYKGFVTEVVAGAPAVVLKLKIDPTEGVSRGILRSGITDRNLQVLLIRELLLDFTGTITYPVYVKLRGTYKIGQATTSEVFTDTTPPNNLDEIGICRVRQPGGAGTDIVVDALGGDLDIPVNRNSPVASVGQDFGFMPGGSFEALNQNVIDVAANSAEVLAAREDIDSFTHANLKTRVDNDSLPAVMAGRLKRAIELIRGIDIPSLGAVGSINVSDSFSSVARDPSVATRALQAFPPIADFAPGGSVSQDGVITLAPRNLVVIIDPNTGLKFIDIVTGRVVYGRITATSFPHAGTVTFSPAATGITTAGDFTANPELAGDLIQGPDGRFYEIFSVGGAGVATLVDAYQAATPTVIASPTIRRFTLTFFISDGVGGDTPYTFPAGPTLIKAWFPVSSSLNIERYDDLVGFFAKFDGGVQDGTTLAKGKVQFATHLEVTALKALQSDDPRVNFAPTKFYGEVGPSSVVINTRTRMKFLTNVNQTPAPNQITHNVGADANFTIPQTGRYRITIALFYNNTVWSAYIATPKGKLLTDIPGTAQIVMNINNQMAFGAFGHEGFSVEYDFTAGDTFDVALESDTNTGVDRAGAVAKRSTIIIERIG